MMSASQDSENGKSERKIPGEEEIRKQVTR